MIPSKKDLTQGIDYVRDKYKAGKIIATSDEATKELEIAVAKATNHDEVPPKEKHIRTLIAMCGPGEPRAQVQMAVHKLAKRAQNNHGWLVTLKCLMSFHRLMRETDAAFMQEVLAYSDHTGHRGVVRLDNYKDVTSKEAWDYSSWIRVYSIFLDERLDLFRLLKFDIQVDKAAAAERVREMSSGKLLDCLPRMQKAQRLLTGCVPEGSARDNGVVMEAVVMIVKESFRLHHILSEAIICLVDRFFDMDRVKAQKALDIYKEAIDGTGTLRTFFDHIKNLDGSVSRVLQFPELSPPPADFVTQMEEYVAAAPVDTSMDDAYTPSPGAASQSRARQASMSSPALAHAKHGSMAGSRLGAVPFPLANQQPAAEDMLKDLDFSDTTPRAPAPASSSDPFGGSDFFSPAGSDDPFGSSQPDPFGGPPAQPRRPSADLFGSNSSPSLSRPRTSPAMGDPFGAPAQTAAPSSAGGSYFDSPGFTPAATQSPASADPFGGASANLFGALAANPFVGSPVAAAPADPFSVAPAAPSAPPPADPFAMAGGGFGAPTPAPPQPAFPLHQMPVRPPANPPPPSNPFAASGLQQSMLTNQSIKSVADPFAELSRLGGAPVPKKGSLGAAAPMRGGPSAMKPQQQQWSSSGGTAGGDPFGGSLF
mmetsp:Transcript_12127/g.31080  ORF Transcript_12127/g.31080 Transcript_12127/m.31080 type:complete len:651 (-) Transcript_12127:126-2078(-)|eukprot:jgi/Tetstr1/460263/TSEL_005563.t1